jgi:hypothetical protein
MFDDVVANDEVEALIGERHGLDVYRHFALCRKNSHP